MITLRSRLWTMLRVSIDSRTRLRSRSSRRGLQLEALDRRELLSVTIGELTYPVSQASALEIVKGPDGNVWIPTGTIGSVSLVKFDAVTGRATAYPIATSASFLEGLTAGPGNTMWVTEARSTIDRFDIASGVVTHFQVDTSELISDLITGPDGKVWFTGSSNAGYPEVGNVDPATGTFTRYTVSTQSSYNVPANLAVGPDQKIYFSVDNTTIGRVTTTGALQTFTVPSVGKLAFAADKTLWINDYFDDKVLHVNPVNGAVLKTYALKPNSRPIDLTVAPDGTVWAAENANNSLAEINPATGTITELALPQTRDSHGSLVVEEPTAIITGPDGNLWYSQGAAFSRVGVVELSGKGPTAAYLTTFGGTVPAGLSSPPQVVSAKLYNATVSPGPGKKPVQKFAGFRVVFTQAVDPTTARSTSSYALTATVKQGKKLVQRAVPYHASLSSSGTTVTLLFTSKTSPFALGGRLVVTTKVLGASGLPLSYARTYVISAGAKAIH